jgi:hypothetical protein
MKFVIFEPGAEIFDPETNESLGCLEIVKGQVQVTHVMPKMSIARPPGKTVTKIRQVPSFLTAQVRALEVYSELLAGKTEEYQVEDFQRLAVESNDPEFDKKRVVRVGDRARCESPTT